MYLVIENNCPTFIGDNLNSLLDFLNVEVKENGSVFYRGIEDTISYNMNEWTKQEVLKDFGCNRLKHIERTLQIVIFKMERLK